MKANPGGQIAVSDIIGRDELVEFLWDTLVQQSVIMTAERRIGKTSVLAKMEAQPRKGWLPLYRDLESIHATADFAIAVYDDVRQHLGRLKKLTNRANKLVESLGGVEVGGVLKLPPKQPQAWKQLLEHAIADLAQEQGETKLVFLWDEMPFMLESIRQREGELPATEVLDVLRSLRKKHPTFRMLLTGSIGLHHVLTKLRETGYANSPVNDMYDVEVTPLAPQDAQELARRLIAGEKLKCNNPGAAVEAVAEASDFFPFYVHHVVKYLKANGLSATPENVEHCVEQQLLAANDPWELAHYRERIDTYYPKDKDLVPLLLDILAVNAGPVAVGMLHHAVKQQMPFDDKERLLAAVELLERDHYIRRTSDGCEFRFPLIKRWWKVKRGL